MVYRKKEDLFEELIVQNRPSGIFNDLLIRSTPSKNKTSLFAKKSAFQDRVTTLACKVLFFDENNAVTKTADLKVTVDNRFLSSVVNKEGNIFICSRSEESLIVEEYTETGEFRDRVQTALVIREGSSFYAVSEIDEHNGQNLMIAVNYKNTGKDQVFQLYRFDFTAKKATSSGDQVLDKSYARSLEYNEAKGAEKLELNSYIDDLQPVKIIRVLDKIVVIREARFFSMPVGSSTRVTYTSGPAVITVFDDQLKNLKEISLSKKYSVFIDIGRSIGCHVQNDKLYLITAALNGPAGCANLFCSINIATMSLEKYEMIKKLTYNFSVSAEPDATLWFRDSFILSQIMPKGTFIMKDVNTVLQKVVF